jgi:energy-coupling factor transport system ATP-binding protein
MDIALEGVSFHYPSGVRALDELDLVIHGGVSIAIVGANGSGKTTLARHLNGLLRPDTGRVTIGGADAAAQSVARLSRSVALCLADPDRQIFARTVAAEVAFGPRQLGMSQARQASAVAEALAAIGLAGHADVHPQDLGEARRKLLSIASMVAMQTAVLVLDEPTVGLDAAGVARVQRLIAELRAAGRTVVGISHDLRFVAESFERVVLLERGQVGFDGPPADVFAEPAWPRLRDAGLEPPLAAILGARLGLGSTPTEAALLRAAAASTMGRP